MLFDSITFSNSCPGIDERLRAFLLQLRAQRIDIDAGFLELGQHRFAVAAVGRHHVAQFAVIGKRLQRRLGHGVHGVRARPAP